MNIPVTGGTMKQSRTPNTAIKKDILFVLFVYFVVNYFHHQVHEEHEEEINGKK